MQVLAEMGIGPNDPAAGAVLTRMGEIKEQQLLGDPAFQTGSRYFKSRHGGGVESALGLFGLSGSDDDLIELILALMGQQQGADEVPLRQQEAAEAAEATAAFKRALQTLGLEQEFGREMTGLEQTYARSELERALGRERKSALETLGSQQAHERGMGLFGRELESRLVGMGQKGEKEQREREMKQAGQASTIDIFGRDPAQSVLFELGALGGGYGELPPL